MEINKKNRSELKHYFLANKIPTQRDFEDFINANLNQAEDGIAKVQGSPIALEAEGDFGGPQEVLNLFTSFSNANPNWSINLNPKVDPLVPTSNKPGFNIKDSTGTSQLFIKSAGGDIGIGTIEPTSRMSIQARADGSALSVVSGNTGSTQIFEVRQENTNGMVSVRAGNGALVSRLSGNTTQPSFLLSKTGIGTESPQAHLHVSTEDVQLRITDTKPGGLPRLTLDNQDNQAWEIIGGPTLQIKAGGVNGQGTLLEKDGHLKLAGGITIGTSPNDINVDGAMYRRGSGTFLSIDDHFFVRHTTKGNKVHIETNTGRMAVGGSNPQAPLSITGPGKYQNPDSAMHITRESILFGGFNNGKHKDSGCISAGTHVANTLTIVGLTQTNTDTERKVEIWAEGGLTIKGRVKTRETDVVAFSVALSLSTLSGNRDPLTFGHVNYNIGDHFKGETHFIAPVDGIYMFALTMRNNSEADVAWALRLNDTGYVNGQGPEPMERSYVRSRLDNHTAARTVITKLSAGDKVHVQQMGGRNDNYSSSFEGILLQALV